MKLVFLSVGLSVVLAAPIPLTSRPNTNVLASLHPQQPNFSSFSLAPFLPTPKTLTLTALTTVPSNCLASASKECTGGGEYQAYNVTYDDCSSPFTICRCNQPGTLDITSAATRLAQVPVGLRRYIATLLLAPEDDNGQGPRAYTLTSGDIHVFGDLEVDSWVHESGHAYDWSTGTPYSNSSAWSSAIANDTCIPDTYSSTGVNENLAQHFVLKIYALLHPDAGASGGGALPPGWNPQCMQHQLAYIDALPVFKELTADQMFGGSCAIGPGGSIDPFSRHSIPPTKPISRVAPTFPPPSPPTATSSSSSSSASSSSSTRITLPTIPKVITVTKNVTTVPVVIVKDNSASSTAAFAFYYYYYYIFMGVVVVGMVLGRGGV